MPRDLDLDFEFQDDEVRERPVRSSRPATHREGSANRGHARAAAPRRKRNDTTSIIILAVEIVVFIVVIAIYYRLLTRLWT